MFQRSAPGLLEHSRQVAEAVKDEYDLDVAGMQVARYGPTKVAGEGLAKKRCDLFEATRRRFREEVAEIPIADEALPAYLGKIYERAHEPMKLRGAVGVLEQAPKETAGAFTNKREHTGAGGGPIQKRTVVIDGKEVSAAVAQLSDDY